MDYIMIKTYRVKVFLILAIMGFINVSMLKPVFKKQGIEGYVYRIFGNQMPSPNIKPSTPKGTKKTTIYIYERTNISQVVRQGHTSFYVSILSKLVTTTMSDSSGYFKIKLPPGRYSLFTKKDTLFYANWFDKDNNIAPIEVLPGKMTKAEIRVDYDAAY